MILYTVDTAFLPLACISIASMVSHCAGNPPAVTILLHDVDALSRNSASKLLSELGLDYELIDVETAWCQPWSARRGQSPAKFGYLKMQDFIDRTVDRVIVVDADTRFVDDVNKLFDADLQGKILGAVDDTAVIATGQLFDLRRKLHLKDHAGYLNSGLLIVDLKAWTDQKIGAACVRVFTDKPDVLTFNDQCALNAVLAGEYARMPLRWNCLYGSVPADWPVSMYHFAGTFKPWSMGLLKHVPYVRNMLGKEQVNFYRQATRQLNWHDRGLSKSEVLDTWKAVRLFNKMRASGRLERYNNRKSSPALQEFAATHRHLIL
jgi:lipopolysaccharide biosynthesis glycosyltransferase